MCGPRIFCPLLGGIWKYTGHRATACWKSPSDTNGPPVRTQTLHRGTPNTNIRAYNRPINSGARFKLVCAFEGVLVKVLVIPKRSGTTWRALILESPVRARKPCTKEHQTHPCDLPTTLKMLVVPKLTPFPEHHFLSTILNKAITYTDLDIFGQGTFEGTTTKNYWIYGYCIISNVGPW